MNKVTGGSGFAVKLLEALPSSSKIIVISRKKRNLIIKKTLNI